MARIAARQKSEIRCLDVRIGSALNSGWTRIQGAHSSTAIQSVKQLLAQENCNSRQVFRTGDVTNLLQDYYQRPDLLPAARRFAGTGRCKRLMGTSAPASGGGSVK